MNAQGVESPGVIPGPGLGDPPRVPEGGDIPVRFPDKPGEIVVSNPALPGSTKSYTPAQVQANGGRVPLPVGTTAGQFVLIRLRGKPGEGFLVEVIGTS